MDWLLVSIFLFMSLVIMAGTDLRTDALIVLVGAVGGLVIEGWGTQTYLWFYYMVERHRCSLSSPGLLLRFIRFNIYKNRF